MVAPPGEPGGLQRAGGLDPLMNSDREGMLRGAVTGAGEPPLFLIAEPVTESLRVATRALEDIAGAPSPSRWPRDAIASVCFAT